MPLSDADKIINLEDLAAFKVKMDESVLHKMGDEIVQGVKTFQNTRATSVAGDSVSTLVVRNPEVTRGVPLENGRSFTNVVLADAEGDTQQTYEGRLAIIEHASPKVDDSIGEYVFMGCYKYDEDSPRLNSAKLLAGYDPDGIAYATAPSTSDERTDSVDIVTRGYMEASEWNWQKTKKAGAVAFKPVPESDLEPVVDFVFTETPPAEGEKGPENPSTITGVTQAKVMRCGKNIIQYPFHETTTTRNGITFTDNGDGTITANGTASSFSQFYLVYPYWDPNGGKLLPAGTYRLSGCPTGGSWNTYRLSVIFSSDYSDYVTAPSDTGSGSTITATKAAIVSLVIQISSGTTVSNLVFKPQLELGTATTAFELYEGNDYTIQLGDTYYGGSLNVATGVMTVTWTKIELNGTETMESPVSVGTHNRFTIDKNILPYAETQDYNICTHFQYSNSYSGDFLHYYVSTVTGKIYLFAINENISSLKAWLASEYANGTPVSVFFKLATPFTVQLTPTQIRSLPALDKYEPRVNTIYTDQEAVQVGYQRYADDPAPLWFVKDMLRANIEAMTSGRNTVVRDKRDNPHIMVVVPKFRLSDIDSNWAATVHPAFIVDGVEKSEILIGKYLASQDASGKVQTLPHQAPWTQTNFDGALAACRELGSGFCLNTNAMWAARVLWDYKRLGGSHVYLGNTSYGRDYTYHELTGTLKSGTYLPGDSSLTDTATLTGTGGPFWNDDGTESGIADLVGNVWECVGGFRLNNGEIQIIPDNDASLADCDMTATSTEWKAVLQDGTLVAPGTADTLKFDSAYADASGNVGVPSLNTSITNSVFTGYNSTDFKSFAATSGIVVPAILKQLAIFPVGNDLQGALLSRNSGEFLAYRGGSWGNGPSAGPFALNLLDFRSSAYHALGFRAGFVF